MGTAAAGECGSTDHQIDQCDSSWSPEGDTDLSELPNGRNSTTSSDEELNQDTVVNLPEANNLDAAATTVENPTDLNDPIPTVEVAPVLGAIADIEPAVVADVELLKNWRPISLLNVNYKIGSKAFPSRLQLILPSLLNSDQTCSVQGRSILQTRTM